MNAVCILKFVPHKSYPLMNLLFKLYQKVALSDYPTSFENIFLTGYQLSVCDTCIKKCFVSIKKVCELLCAYLIFSHNTYTCNKNIS